MTEPQLDLRRAYRRRWIVRFGAVPLAASFVLSGIGLLLRSAEGFRVNPVMFAVPALGVLMLAAWIIDEVRLAQNQELLRTIVGGPEWTGQLYERRWYWRVGMVGGGLLLLGLGVSALLPAADAVGTLTVGHVECYGGVVCDASGTFQPDGGGAAVPFVLTTFMSDQGIRMGSVVRVKQIDDIRVTTDLDWSDGPDWAVAVMPIAIGLVLVGQWVFLETRIRPVRAQMKRSAAASVTMAPAATLLDAAGGVVFRDGTTNQDLPSHEHEARAHS